jgi:hypothetical protein
MTDPTGMAIVFQSEVTAKWCPITEHFISDDGIAGFEHYVEWVPEPIRCSLDWSEHPIATMTTTIRLGGKNGSHEQ